MTRKKPAPLMVVVVRGSRCWKDQEVIRRRLSELRAGSAVIVGDAPGADAIARKVASEIGLEVLPLDATPAELAEELIDWLLDLTTSPEERLVLAFHENLAVSTNTARFLSIARDRGVAVGVIASGEERR